MISKCGPRSEALRSLKIILVMAFLALSLNIPARAQESWTPAQQFEHLKTFAGAWSVEGSETLTIRFEITANGTVLIENWETPSGLHSMTIYHMDGAELIGTHYCPQGNQPRLVAQGLTEHNIVRLTFKDATDLDSSEGFAHDLEFTYDDNGNLQRREVYWNSEGAESAFTYTLNKADRNDDAR